MEQQCSRCLTVKPSSDFSPDKRNKRGTQSRCRECQRNGKRADYADPDKRARALAQNADSRRERYATDSEYRRGILDKQAEVYAGNEEYRERTKARSRKTWGRYHADADFRAEHLRRRKAIRDADRDIRPRVYFVKAGEHVKIGFTINRLRFRLQALQQANAHALNVLGIIYASRDLEKRLHVEWSRLHVRGEWFHAAPELMEWIREHATAPDV